MNDHYDIGGISTIDFIRAKLTTEQYKGFLLGNMIKYVSRINYKGAPEQDAIKAAEYSVWLAEYLKETK